MNKNIDVQISQDKLTAYIRLEKPQEDEAPATREELLEALSAQGVIFGIRDNVLDKLSSTPVYGFRMEAAKGIAPIVGQDGRIEALVKKDRDYAPEYSEEGTVDYKNIDYFQLVKAGQVLCEIIPATPGEDGTDVFGKPISAREGKAAQVPQGENTAIDDDGARLVALCDGLVKYKGSRIDISDLLQIRSDVNYVTGNITFSGDVSISGDVSNGFTVKAGGNVIIRGVIEDATVEAGGSLHVVNGINGDGKNRIRAGAGLTCKYIENAIIDVEGDIKCDYIIDSDIRCSGDIILSGTKEILLGGNVVLGGELRARDIGNVNERSTRIEFTGVKAIDERRIQAMEKERAAVEASIAELLDMANQLGNQIQTGKAGMGIVEQLISLKQQIQFQSEKMEETDRELALLRRHQFTSYTGFITCRRKIYQGVRIYFGESRFQFMLDNIDHCRICWIDGQIVHSVL